MLAEHISKEYLLQLHVGGGGAMGFTVSILGQLVKLNVIDKGWVFPFLFTWEES